jgi:hypothetical protein
MKSIKIVIVDNDINENTLINSSVPLDINRIYLKVDAFDSEKLNQQTAMTFMDIIGGKRSIDRKNLPYIYKLDGNLKPYPIDADLWEI